MSDQPQIDLNVSVERVSDNERRLAVEIPWPEVKGRLDKAYNELRTGVQIRGFRRGKAPRSLLQKLFGEHIEKDVVSRLVGESLPLALKKGEVEPVSEPDVADEGIAEGEAFRYAATVQVVPEIEPRDYDGVEVRRRPARVSDEDVDAAIEAKRRELTTYRSVEGRAIARTDVVTADILGKVGDEPVDAQAVEIHLDQPERAPLPGLVEALLGKPAEAGDLEIELDVPIHDHGPNEPCPGDEKTARARLLLTVKEVREKIVPALDDEFAKDTGEAESLAELREKVRAELVEKDEARALDEAKSRLIDTLLEKNDVPAPPALVAQRAERFAQIQSMLMGGMPPEVREQLADSAAAEAERSVRQDILLDAIARVEGIKVTEADVEAEIAKIAAASGENVARVRARYEKQDRIAELERRIAREAALDLVMSKAKVIEDESLGAGEASAAGADGASPPEEATGAAEGEGMASEGAASQADAGPSSSGAGAPQQG